MTEKRRYAKGPKKDPALTLSGLWLAGLTFATAEPGQLGLVAYLRLSVEKLSETDHLKALQRQWATCQTLAKKLGGVIVAVRADIAKSADTRKGARPEFQALLVDLPSHDGLVGSHFWRVARDPEDVTDLVRVYEANPDLKFATPQEALNLATPMGRAAAYGAASKGLEDLAIMSERQCDRHAQLRADGRYVGPRMFGVCGDDNDQEEKGEADRLRLAAVDILQGKAVWEIQREWEAAGVLSPRGTAMSRSSIRNMLLSPRMMGYLVHKPQVRPGEARPPRWEWTIPGDDHRPARSQVPAILAQGEEDDSQDVREALWRALIVELSGRGERQRARVNTRATYVLSGLCWGMVCGEPMNGQWVKSKGHHIYRCLKGCCSVHGPNLDQHIRDLLLYLWSERAEAVVPDTQPFLQQAEKAHWEAELENVDRLYKAREMSLEEKLSTKRDIESQLVPVQQAWAEWVRATAAPAPVHTTDQWLKAEAKGDISAMRRMARAELRRVEVSKAQGHHRGFEAGRVNPVWRPASAAVASVPENGEGQPGHAA